MWHNVCGHRLVALFLIVCRFFGSLRSTTCANIQQKFQYHCIDRDGQVTLCPNNLKPEFRNDLVAYSKFSNRINETGWSELQLVTNRAMEDRTQAYYAGMLEGMVTSKLIESYFENLYENQSLVNCKENEMLISENLNWILENVKKVEKIGTGKDSSYWTEVGNVLYQMAGLEDGYRMAQGENAPRKPHLNSDPCSMMLMINLYFEMLEFRNILNKTASPGSVETGSRCSAIVKVLPGLRDIAIAHNTWGNPKTMLRIMKRYEFNFSTSKAPTIVMPSYPGSVFSSDDFYITSQKLVLQETTNENYNQKLYTSMQNQRFVFEFARNMVANRLAQNGSEWTEWFSMQNSGTYNNQFMVVDYKRFQPGKPIQHGLFTVLEQLPTVMVVKDMSDVLSHQTYWPSFNVPYFESIQNLSGYRDMYLKRGDHFSHENCPRSKIFRRDHSKVTNLTTLFYLMRYNDILHDPLSRCAGCDSKYSPGYTIASRFDLPDLSGTYPNEDNPLRSWAAIDAKMTTFQLVMNDLEMVAVSGPTDQNVEQFSWETTKLSNVPHRDQPTNWNFKPFLVSWQNETEVFSNFNFDL